MTSVAASSWRHVQLGDVIDRIEAGKSFACEPRRAGDDEWGVIKVSAMTYGKFIETENKAVPSGVKFPRAAEIRPGDLLMSRANTRDYVGASVLVGRCRPHLLLSDKSLRLHPSPLVDRRWLWYALSAPQTRHHLSDASTGIKSGMRNISQVSVRAVPLLLPPIDEQRRIVEILEDHLSHLNVGTKGVTRSSQRLKLWEAVGLQTVLTEESSGHVRLASLINRIEVGRSFGGSARPAGVDEWGIIKVSAMTRGTFRPDENKVVPPEAIDERFEIRPDDLLLSRANTSTYVGASVLVDETRPRLLLSDKSLRLVPASNVDVRWLAAALTTLDARRQISTLATGTKDSMRNISQKKLLTVVLPAASAEQQQRVVRRRQDITSRARRSEAQFGVILDRAANLRRALLWAAFSGRLTGRSSDVDVVEELAGV